MRAETKVAMGLLAWLMAIGLSGCVTSSIEELRQAPVVNPLVATDAVVVLGRRQRNNRETEHSFTDCVSDALADADLNIYPTQKFKNQMFPWFEPRVAPITTASLPRLINDAAVAERLRETGVRYIVWLAGKTRDGDKGGSMSCAAGPGGGGCLGFLWWEKNAAYEASIWDVRNIQSVGSISVDATGTSYVPALIIPIPLIARTQHAACEGVAQQVREFLRETPGT